MLPVQTDDDDISDDVTYICSSKPTESPLREVMGSAGDIGNRFDDEEKSTFDFYG